MPDDRRNVRKLPAEAAAYLLEEWRLSRSVRTLQTLRRTGGGPAFHRSGNTIVYTTHALDAWAEERLGAARRSSSEQSALRLVTNRNERR
jgi:hypothetical protein